MTLLLILLKNLKKQIQSKMAKTENALLAPNLAEHPLVKKIVDAKVDLTNCAPIAVIAQTAIDLVANQQQHLSLKAENHEDSTAIELAKKIRSQIKKDRVASEKHLDAERAEVQSQMTTYKDQDTALLKIKQYVSEELKTVEAHLEDQEKIKERYEEQQRQQRISERNKVLEELCDDPSIYNVGDMSLSAFEALVFGIKAQKEAAEKAVQEEQRRLEREKQLDVTFQERRFQLQKYSVLPDAQDKILSLTRETSEEDFTNLKEDLDILLTAFNNAAEIARKEAEETKRIADEAAAKAKAEADKALKKQQDERKHRETQAISFLGENNFELTPDHAGYSHKIEPYFIGRNFFTQLDSEEELEQFKHNVETQLDSLIKQRAAEKAKKEADEIIRKQREEQQRIEQEKLVKASATITEWVDQYKSPEYIDTKNPDVEDIRKDILAKFEAFKVWAKKRVNN